MGHVGGTRWVGKTFQMESRVCEGRKLEAVVCVKTITSLVGGVTRASSTRAAVPCQITWFPDAMLGPRGKATLKAVSVGSRPPGRKVLIFFCTCKALQSS